MLGLFDNCGSMVGMTDSNPTGDAAADRAAGMPGESPLPRRGRPRIQDAADDIVAGVLATAGPRVGGRDYSSRRIALMTGLSQPVVSRAMRRIRSGAGPAAAGAAGAAGNAGVAEGAATADVRLPVVARAETENPRNLRVREFRVEYPRLTILFEQGGREVHGERQASARRAAAVMAVLRVSGVSGWPQRQAAFDAGDDPLPAGVLRVIWEPGGQGWDAFLAQVSAVLDSCAASVDAIPGDLLARLSGAVGRGLHGVQWQRTVPRTRSIGEEDAASGTASGSAPDTSSDARRTRRSDADFDSNYLSLAEYPPPTNARMDTTPRHLQNEISVTEQIAIALRKEIMNAGYQAGDRVTSPRLAQHMDIPVSAVRSAMRRMVDDGLLTTSGGSFALPLVTGKDIIDLYAARLQVGRVILRACTARSRHHLLASQLALRGVVAAAEQGTAADVDQADLHFQQTLADASGLPQSSRIFHQLTLRLRMFISVLQLDYTPAVQRIVSDDRSLLDALMSGESGKETALRVWRGKLDNAVRHMVYVSPTRFDPELWEQLVGKVK